jgi:hypothetical protein
MMGLLMLGACQAKDTNATDEQLLTLFGEKSWRSERPGLQISKSTIECIRLLSGLDDQIYKDAPAEMLGVIKTECRKSFDGKLGNEELNSIGLTFKDIESQAFAERLTALKLGVDAEMDAREKASREKIQAERIAKIKAAIAGAENEVTRFSGELAARLLEISGLCEDWKRLKEQLTKTDRNSPYRWRLTPNTCQKSYHDNVRQQIQTTLERVAKLKTQDAGTLLEYSIPGVDFTRQLGTNVSSLREEVKVMQSLAAKVN